MTSNVILREKVLLLMHRWHWVAGLFLFGCLVGWLIAQRCPTPYQASLELYIGLDPSQTQNDRHVAEFAQFEFTNPDDYKHWQMSQLSLLVVFDDVLQETLQRLREKDPYWNTMEVADLREHVRPYWRNAGRWRLVAEAKDPQHAAQLVLSWREVILEKMNEAVAYSRQLRSLDRRLSALEQQRVELDLRLTTLNEVKNALNTWQETLGVSSQSATSLDVSDHWRLWALAAQAAGYSPGWQSLLARIPAPSAPLQAFDAWVKDALTLIEQDIASIHTQMERLDAERERLSVEWEQTLPAGRGLSAGLLIEAPSQDAPQVEAVRPTALISLVSGMASLILGTLVAWTRWTRERNS